MTHESEVGICSKCGEEIFVSKYKNYEGEITCPKCQNNKFESNCSLAPLIRRIYDVENALEKKDKE